MKPAQLHILLAAVLITTQVSAQSLPEGDPAKLGFDPQRLEILDEKLQGFVDDNSIAGSVAIVLREGQIIYSEARGQRNLEEGLPMEHDTLFRVASQTKSIVSTAIMMLHERGDLLISDPLSRYLPEWADAQVGVRDDDDEEYELEDLERPIRLRDLLTHTSGIGYGMGDGPVAEAWVEAGITGWHLSSRDEPIRETVRQMATLPLPAQPGTEWIYGYNTDILGAVVEVVSGMSLAEFLRKEIFEPLGMEDTHFFPPESKADRLAVVYQPTEEGLEPVPEGDGMMAQGRFMDGPRRNFSGGAGLISTAGDYARFLQMLLNEGELNDERLLSPKTVELMTVNHLDELPRSGEGMGLGVYVVTDLGIRGTLGSEGEFGWGGAYHSTYWVDPEEDLVVVYLTQILGVADLNDFDVFRATLYGSLIDD